MKRRERGCCFAIWICQIQIWKSGTFFLSIVLCSTISLIDCQSRENSTPFTHTIDISIYICKSRCGAAFSAHFVCVFQFTLSIELQVLNQFNSVILVHQTVYIRFRRNWIIAAYQICQPYATKMCIVVVIQDKTMNSTHIHTYTWAPTYSNRKQIKLYRGNHTV